MKNIFTVLFLLFVFTCYGQSYLGNSSNRAVITWKNDIHDFGKIKQGKPVFIIYKFKNDGLKPLIIKKVVSSCGCTVPEYPRIPIRPMSGGEIKATFDSKKVGVFSKSVSVTTNASEKPKVLILKGEVIPG